jgi:hypothetical protein
MTAGGTKDTVGYHEKASYLVQYFENLKDTTRKPDAR